MSVLGKERTLVRSGFSSRGNDACRGESELSRFFVTAHSTGILVGEGSNMSFMRYTQPVSFSVLVCLTARKRASVLAY